MSSALRLCQTCGARAIEDSMLPIVVHPALIHFPLAMLFSAWVCLLVLHATGDRAWDDRLRLFELVGVATTPLVIVTGFIDDAGSVFEFAFDDAVIWHASAGITASLVFGAHFLWRSTQTEDVFDRRVAVIDVSWATVAMWLFVLTGFIGGEMVHG